MNRRIQYLRVGDHVYQKKYSRWGIGAVVEEWNSTLPGGPFLSKWNFRTRGYGYLTTISKAHNVVIMVV
jgi:hypothetical protein